MIQDLTTTSILALFQTTKEERQSFTLDLISKIENGEADPLKIHLQIKCMEEIIKLLNSNTIYKQAILAAAEQYGQKSFEFMNSKVEIKEMGTKYDYSKCNDPELADWYKQKEELDAKIKEKEKFLQTVPEKGLDILKDDEVIKVYRPSKSSTTSIAVTLK